MKKRMEIVAVKSGKGGCDKTTATINIAAADAVLFGKKILIIDTDGRAHTTSMFCDSLKHQIGDVLLDRVNALEAIEHTRWKNIDCIGCGEEINDDVKELEKNIFMDPMHRFGKVLNKISEMGVYDRCYIDCNQDPDLVAVNILLSADRVLIPARSDDYSLEGVHKMMDWIHQVSPARDNEIKTQVMITDKERNLESDDSVRKIKLLFGDHVCKTFVRHQAKVVQHSYKPAIRTPFVLAKKPSGVANDYIQLVKEIYEYE